MRGKITMNIRKHKVNSVFDIHGELEGNLRRSFAKICNEGNIGDDYIVNFWNKLVEFKKLDKDNLSEDLFHSALLTLGTGQILAANGNPIMAGIANLATIGLASGSLIAKKLSGSPAGKVFEELSEMLIEKPDLYDIELIFNGYTKETIDTSEFDGKAIYQQLHDERYQTKSPVDLQKETGEEETL